MAASEGLNKMKNSAEERKEDIHSLVVLAFIS